MALRKSSASALIDRLRIASRASSRASGGGLLAESVSNQSPISGVPTNIPARFRFREKLGQGGMGAVFRTYDTERGHDVALKSLTRLNPDDLYRLKTEFRSLTQLRHPNLVDLYELFVENAEGFFTMELVPGTDFVAHVRGGSEEQRCDFARLRESGRQLALAIRAVHAAGKLHRDIKPSNIRVTKADRVVLLDFGLVDPLSDRMELTHATGALVGTIEYMPPEQARGEALGPAADWYGFGVTLFEAITGRLPLERPLQWLLGDPHLSPPLPLRKLAPDVPRDLDELISALLTRDPNSRPTGNDVLKALTGDASPPSMPSVAPPDPTPRPHFDGREAELAQLEAALALVEGGNTVLVRLHGPSGIGKSELVRRFLENVERRGGLVLSGRCHPREWVAFNALDGVVDDLSRTLEQWSREQVLSILPRSANVLPRLFPVLGRIAAIEDAETPSNGAPAQEALRSAAQALKELLASVADRRRLVLWLDDVQWGDQDSGSLLSDFLSLPDSPAALVILSYRSEAVEESRMLTTLRDARAGSSAIEVELPLAPLTEEQSVALVERLVGEGWKDDPDAMRRLVREADGLPFFILEVARLIARGATSNTKTGTLRLSDLLSRRVGELSDEERELLEVVSVFAGPLDQRLLFRAAGSKRAVHQGLAQLERTSLIRGARTGARREWEIYHHRIRDAVLGGLDDTTKRRHHRTIADGLLTTDEPNLAQVVEHYEAAGELDGVRRYLVAAAKRTTDLLAFGRAAELYRRAIELGGTELTEHELHERLGDALASAGHGREAGRVLERAALLAESVARPADEVLNLRRRAATEYLRSWQRDDAMRMLGVIAAPLGIAMPRGVVTALAEAVMNRASIALRRKLRVGYPLDRTAPRRIVEKLDVTEMLMKVAANTEPVMGFAFGSRLLKEALEVGDPDLVFRGLCCEGVAWAAIDQRFAQRAADSHMEQAARLLEARPDPLHEAWFLQCMGHVTHFRGEFDASLGRMRDALERYRSIRRAHSVDYANALAFYLPALAIRGQIGTLRTEMESALGDAERRGDEYLIAACAAGTASLGWIVSGRVQDATRWAARVRSLAPPRFSTQHYFHLVTMVQVALYEGRGVEASAAIEHAWPEILQNRFVDIATVGDDLRALRGRAAIAGAVEHLASGARDKAENLLGVAASEASLIERDGTGYARALAGLLHAGVSFATNDERAADRHLADALARLDSGGIELFGAACRHALFRSNAASRASAELWMDAAGVVDRAAIVRLCVPGILP